jgi:hypothetical protein
VLTTLADSAFHYVWSLHNWEGDQLSFRSKSAVTRKADGVYLTSTSKIISYYKWAVAGLGP